MTKKEFIFFLSKIFIFSVNILIDKFVINVLLSFSFNFGWLLEFLFNKLKELIELIFFVILADLVYNISFDFSNRLIFV
jgi:hypothetical protein